MRTALYYIDHATQRWLNTLCEPSAQVPRRRLILRLFVAAFLMSQIYTSVVIAIAALVFATLGQALVVWTTQDFTSAQLWCSAHW